MKTLIKIITALLMFSSVWAQEFTVEKINGKAEVLRGTSEKWNEIKVGQKLNGNDLLMTEDNSYVQLNKAGSRFILQSNSALGLNHIKKVSINDLLLALAMEEIRNVPKTEGNGNSYNTAVYGTETKPGNNIKIVGNNFGYKKLKGAKQLAASGFEESAIIVAKETYRNYPETKSDVKYRIYFADLLTDLKLYEEAYSELASIKQMELNTKESKDIDERIEKVKMEILNK